MKYYHIALLTVSLIVGCTGDRDLQINTEPSGGFVSYYGGKQYDFDFDQKDFAECPHWILSDAAPPLGFESAAQAARNRLASVLKSDVKDWQLSGIELNAFGAGKHWVYHIEFMSPPKGEDMMRESFEIPVLMSGKTVRPSIHDDGMP